MCGAGSLSTFLWVFRLQLRSPGPCAKRPYLLSLCWPQVLIIMSQGPCIAVVYIAALMRLTIIMSVYKVLHEFCLSVK